MRSEPSRASSPSAAASCARTRGDHPLLGEGPFREAPSSIFHVLSRYVVFASKYGEREQPRRWTILDVVANTRREIEPAEREYVMRPFDDNVPGSTRRFSDHIVLRKDDGLHVLTLPELETVRVVPLEGRELYTVDWLAGD
jgi:hypothetical protein